MLFIISPLETAFEPRGTRTRHLLESLSLSKEKIVLITSNFDHSRKRKLDPNSIIQSNPVETIVLCVPSYTKNISIRRVIFQIVFAVKVAGVLICRTRPGDLVFTMLSFPELTLANLAARLIRGCRNAVDVWDIWPDALVGLRKTMLTNLFSLYCNCIYQLTLRSMDQVFYVAPSFATWAGRYGVPKDRLRFVPLGYDSVRWDPVANAAVDSTLNGQPITLTYVGYLAEQFDLRLLLDALCSGETVHLTILGDGPYFDAYRTKAAGKPVTLSGHVSFEDVEATLQRTAIGVLPISDGAGAELPNKFFDYLGAGIPVLVVGGADAGELVTKSGIGWHIPQDIESIRIFLSTLNIEDITRKRKMVSITRKNYSKDKLYQPLLAYLQQAV